MKRQGKISKADSADSGQFINTVALLNSTYDFEIGRACVVLYQLVEISNENKLKVAGTEGCLEKLVNLLSYECLSIRRLSCMILASLSLNVNVRREMRQVKCLVQKLLYMVKCGEDNILKENVLLLISSLANEFSWKVSICDEGGLLLLFDCLRSDDPDIVKNSLQTLALVLQFNFKDYGAKAALHSCNNIQEVFEFLFSEHLIIKKLATIVLIEAADYAPMKIVLGMKGIINALVGCLMCLPNENTLAYALVLLSKCLSVANVVEEFVSFNGIGCLLNFLKPKSSEVEATEERKGNKKTTLVKNKKSKEGELHLSPINSELPLIQVPDMKDSIFECLQKIAIYPKCYRALQREGIDNLLVSLLSSIETNGKTLGALLNLLGVLCYYIKSRLFFGERVNILIKPISSNLSNEDQNFLKSLAFFFSNLLYECPKNHRLVLDSGASQIIMALLKSSNEEVILFTCGLICNLSGSVQMRAELISFGLDAALVDLLKSQIPSPEGEINPKSEVKNEDVQKGLPFQESNALIERTLLTLACLSLDGNVRNQILESDVLKIIISLLASDHPKIQRASSLLISKLAMDSQLADNIINLYGMHILYNLHMSKSRNNRLSDHALNQLYKFKPVEKFAFQGVLCYEDDTKDGFYDAGQIPCDKAPFETLKPLQCYVNEDCKRWRPIFVVNTKKPKSSIPENNPSSPSQNDAESQKKEAKGKHTKPMMKTDASHQQTETAATQDIENVTKLFEVPEDNNLFSLVEKCQAEVINLQTTEHQVIALAKLVSETMGGQIMSQYLSTFEWETHLKDLKRECNLVSLGKVKFGIHFHRALLFKVLADKINIPCSLKRREYNRGFVEVTLMEEKTLYSPVILQCVQQVVPEKFIVDLITQPGRLIPVDSPYAEKYSSL